MNITSYVQNLWNRYRKEKESAEAENRRIDLEKIANRKIYLGPGASDTFTSYFTVLQGFNDGENNAPIKLELTYTVVVEQ